MQINNLYTINATFSGLVQGVGFRQSVLQIAQHFELKGRVKNLENGTVELIAEGDREKVDSFLKMGSPKKIVYVFEREGLLFYA